MDRTACTEPQCLYKGALYHFLSDFPSGAIPSCQLKSVVCLRIIIIVVNQHLPTERWDQFSNPAFKTCLLQLRDPAQLSRDRGSGSGIVSLRLRFCGGILWRRWRLCGNGSFWLKTETNSWLWWAMKLKVSAHCKTSDRCYNKTPSRRTTFTEVLRNNELRLGSKRSVLFLSTSVTTGRFLSMLLLFVIYNHYQKSTHYLHSRLPSLDSTYTLM